MSKNSQVKHKVVFVNSDDWQGMYVDGRLEYENHTISSFDMMNVLGKSADGYSFEEEIVCDQQWIESIGHLPKRLDRVRRA